MNIVDNRFEIWPNPVSGYTGDSESERLGLLYYTNINVNPLGYFEAANPSVAARIDSQIDLRGVVSDYTVAVDFEAADFGGLTNQKQELAGQGAAVSSYVAAICSLAYYKTTGTQYFLQLTQQINGIRRYTFYVFSSPLVARCVVAGSVKIVGNSTILCIYLNGVLIKTETISGVPVNTAVYAAENFSINDNRNGAFTNYFGKIYAAALFNRALPDSQINLLSH